jgi:signal recognition particle subunit SRP54
MMEQMAKGGGMPGMPGMPAMGGGKRAGARQQPQAKGKKGKKRISGNPAKAAQQQAAERAAAAETVGNPFGNPDGAEVDYEKAAEQLNLPKDFSQFLK